MRTSVVFILLAMTLVVVLLTPDPVHGKTSSRRGWLGRAVKKVVKTAEKILEVLKILEKDQKRAVAAPTDPLTEDGLLQHVAALVTSCPEKLESTLTDLTKQFEELDANGDDTLTGEELTNFNTFLGNYTACQ